MARIGENAFRQYRDGQDRLTAPEYMAERELIRLAVNDLDDKIQRTEGIREEFSNTVNEIETVKGEVVQTKQEVEVRLEDFSQTLSQTASKEEVQQIVTEVENKASKEEVIQVSEQLSNKASKSEVQEVSLELREKVSYPIQSWEYENSSAIVENVTFAHGDIRRYGCPCNGVDDDSVKLQKAFDICGRNAQSIFIPNVPMVIRNPIILRDKANYTYNVIGDTFRTTGNIITCQHEYCFVGEKFYSETPTFTQVTINMNDVVIRCTTQKDVTIFKAMEIYNGEIFKNKFYFPTILLEGSFSAWTRFNDNRVQGFRRCFVTGSSTLPGVSFDTLKAELKNNNFDYKYLNGKIVRTTDGTGPVHFLKCNDSYIRDNYISGSISRDVIPSVLEIDDIDVDVSFDNNWFEFCEYFVKPMFYMNTPAESKNLYGTTFTNNTLQVFYRLFDENSRYNSWVFENNKFMAFARSSMASRFTNAPNAPFRTKKCGVLVADRTDGDMADFFKIILSNNYVVGSDYYIYLDCGTSSKIYSVQEKGSKLLAGLTGVTNVIYVRTAVASNTSSFTESWYDLLNNRIYTETPVITDATNKYINVFNGQTMFINGVPSLVSLDSSNKPRIFNLI